MQNGMTKAERKNGTEDGVRTLFHGNARNDCSTIVECKLFIDGYSRYIYIMVYVQAPESTHVLSFRFLILVHKSQGASKIRGDDFKSILSMTNSEHKDVIQTHAVPDKDTVVYQLSISSAQCNARPCVIL